METMTTVLSLVEYSKQLAVEDGPVKLTMIILFASLLYHWLGLHLSCSLDEHKMIG